MAKDYAKNYEFIEFAGTDNHTASNKEFLGGMMSESPLNSESEFIDAYKANKLTPFVLKNPLFVK